jgi:hypothetical protein
MSDDTDQPTPRKLNFLQMLRTVGWGLLGLRRRSGHDGDISAGMDPVHLIIVALVATALFIVVLIGIARLFISHAI